MPSLISSAIFRLGQKRQYELKYTNTSHISKMKHKHQETLHEPHGKKEHTSKYHNDDRVRDMVHELEWLSQTAKMNRYCVVNL